MSSKEFTPQAPRHNFVQVGNKAVVTMVAQVNPGALQVGDLVEYEYHGATYRAHVVNVRPHSFNRSMLVSTARHHFETAAPVWKVWTQVLDLNKAMTGEMVGAGALSVNEALFELEKGQALSWGVTPLHPRLQAYSNTENRD